VAESRKVAAILVADIVGYSRLTAADEEGTLTRLRALRGGLIDPTISSHDGRLVKRTGDGAIVEFRSVVEAVRCAIEVRNGLAQANALLPDHQRIKVRVGIHLGDVIEEADGDLMGDGVNIAARLEGISEPDTIALSEDAYRQVRDKVDESFIDLGEQNLKNIPRPMRVYALTGRAGARPGSPSPTAALKSTDSRERRSTFAPILQNIVIPSLAGKSRGRSARREAVTTTVAAILQNIARPKRAGMESAAAGARPVVGSSGAVPAFDPRSQRRNFLRALIIVGIFATLATRVSRAPEPFAPSSSRAPPFSGAVEDRLAKAQRLSIIVLPFENLSGDPGQDHVADGLTDDLTTDLSHLPDSFVIAHSTALAFKGNGVEARHLRRLGVRYALEGSVRRAGETVVVNAQLVATETGAQIWADRLECEPNGLGALQADLVSRVANALGVQPPKAGQPAQ
jgi:class 3 adenylate cyclase/TolB-like protein